MQTTIKKITAIILSTILMGVNFISSGVYAANAIKQDAKTSQENVEFDATINGDYSASTDVDSELTLNLNVKVLETGYLKNAVVTLKNGNYEISNTDDLNVKSINGNTIELNEIKAGEILSVAIPIKLNKSEYIDKDLLGRDSIVTLNAIYVNAKGNEKKIEKSLNQHIEWNADPIETISQKLIRYIKYDENNTMISFELKDGIKDDKIPATKKEISVITPKLADKFPTKVIVTGTQTSYDYKDGIITIAKNQEENSDGKLKWNSQDTYMITYIYENQADQNSISTSASAKVTVKGNEIQGTTENNEFEITEEVGNIIEAEASTTSEISKGYMYTNINRSENKLTTSYEALYKINVPLTDIIDKVKVVEDNTLLNQVKATDSVTDKKISINKEELVNVLGEDGIITIYDANGENIGALSKDTTELEVNTSKVVYELSKPKTEGNIYIAVKKEINGDIDYSENQIKSFEKLTSTIKVEGYSNENVISNKEINVESKLTEPTSNASIDISTDNLSTVVTNEDVVITATLKTNDITDALYKDPTINITLPSMVNNINLKDAKLIYEDELVPVSFETTKNQVNLKLSGTQTQYSTQATSEGTVIRLVADLTVDNLAPSSEEAVSLVYTNDATGESKTVKDKIRIVAPTGFVTVNTLEVDGTKIIAQESDDKITKIQPNSDEKELKISATVVNNLGSDATGFTVLGTIPFSGNTDAKGNDLQSNFDTFMTSDIKVEGINSTVYYSENGKETVDGASWTTTFSENAKAYKIVAKDIVTNATKLSFSYNVKTPKNLQYANTSKASYAVYYNNNAEAGNMQNVVVAKTVGVTTGEIPVITTNATLVDASTGKEIKNGEEVKEAQYLNYNVKIMNTGKENATNVKLDTILPSGIGYVEQVNEMSDVPRYNLNNANKTLTQVIDNIEANTSKNISYKLEVSQIISSDPSIVKEQEIKTILTADKIEDSVSSTTTVNNAKGSIVGIVTSNKMNMNVRTGDKVQYYLSIKNANYDEKNNVKATISIPQGVKFDSIVDNNSESYNYDEKNRTLVFEVGTLKAGTTTGVLINATFDSTNELDATLTAKISAEGMDEVSVEGITNRIVTDKAVTSTLTSNISESQLSDKDELEYYIDVKNNSNSDIESKISDTIPTSLRVKSYRIKDENGEKTIETASRTVISTLNVKANSTARLTIVTVPYDLDKNSTQEIENTASVTINGESNDTDSIKHTIQGTSNLSNPVASSDNNSNNDNNNKSDNDSNTTNENIAEGTYKISGTVWFDSNYDGKKEEHEEKISEVVVKLFDKNTGNIAKDINNSELSRTTDSNGKYTFANIVNGNYIVVAEYDNSKYDIASYNVDGLSDAENSDFVEAKLDEKDVAATNTISIENANIYNIDLGLVSKKKFDLSLNKTITRITVSNTKAKTKAYEYDRKNIAKVELSNSYVEYATVLVEYTISVTNEGQIAGYAKSIIDYIPAGMNFSSELNSDWYLGQDGNGYNTSLANVIINPGETKEIKIVLSRKMNGENIGTVRNTSEILSSYNEYGLKDIDSTAGNKQDGEDDISSADVIIGMATGKEVASITGIVLGILSIITLAVYEIKKHVINKMYNIL